MKKFLYPLLLSIAFPLFSLSQSYEGTIEYEKKKQQAFVIDYAYPPEAVENAFIQKMERMGYKGREEKGVFNKDKGFRVYKGAYVTEISDQSMDYIVKIEQKSRKDKDATTVYMIINKDGENAMRGFNASDVERAKEFLNNLMPDVQAAHLEIQIRDQENLISKTEKKLKSLKDDKKDMEEKIRKLQKDIKDNEKDQAATQEQIANQQLALEALRGKRRT